ncbi:MAG TPA: hypothetical protein VKC61_02095 [Pyrinomonadaceae bacterium]|nr:hypothetical protein [Pyrinomonadaceae bacterium]
MSHSDHIVILTPVKDAARHLNTYLKGLFSLSYPRHLLSVAFLESDSVDDTHELFAQRIGEFEATFRRVALYKKDFGYPSPTSHPRWASHLQLKRRTVLAKSRNHLLFRALDDEDWVLWLDVDVIEYPPDIIERLLATGKDIVQPHCVCEYGGRSFDTNAWRDHGTLHLDDLRSEGEVVPLDSVGGTMLLVRADVHRDGLLFPAFPYGIQNLRIRTDNLWMGEIETEGFGIMAHDLGVQCWGLPNLEIKHHPS